MRKESKFASDRGWQFGRHRKAIAQRPRLIPAPLGEYPKCDDLPVTGCY